MPLVDSGQRDRLVNRFGHGALDWLERLPALVNEIAQEWELTIDGPAQHGRTSVVLHCRGSDGVPAILKISPDPGLLSSEARVLRLWERSRRVPEVWHVDSVRGAVLMEAVGQGRTVAAIGEVPAMEEIGALIDELHSADISCHEAGELHPLLSRIHFLFDLWEHRRAEGEAASYVHPALLHRGHARARELAHRGEDTVPLHGDLHPGNVLDGGPQRGLVAVDPRACMGDAAADGLEWPLWRATTLAEVEHRAAVLAPLIGVSTDRLLAWCRACAPLFAVAWANLGRTDTAEFTMLLEMSSP